MDTETKKLNSELERQLAIVDRTWLRPIQRDMFACSAVCCDDSNASADEMNHCLQKCSFNFQESFNYTLQQFDQFQLRVQSCVQSCHDEARDPLTDSSTKADVDAAMKKFDQCSLACIHKMSQTIPSMLKRIEDFVTKKVL